MLRADNLHVGASLYWSRTGLYMDCPTFYIVSCKGDTDVWFGSCSLNTFLILSKLYCERNTSHIQAYLQIDVTRLSVIK